MCVCGFLYVWGSGITSLVCQTFVCLACQTVCVGEENKPSGHRCTHSVITAGMLVEPMRLLCRLYDETNANSQCDEGLRIWITDCFYKTLTMSHTNCLKKCITTCITLLHIVILQCIDISSHLSCPRCTYTGMFVLAGSPPKCMNNTPHSPLSTYIFRIPDKAIPINHVFCGLFTLQL